MAFLTRAPLDLGRLVARVTAPARGGIACFLGVVRDHHAGRTVASLEYSAYEAMAEAECARIAAEARALASRGGAGAPAWAFGGRRRGRRDRCRRTAP